MATPLWIVFACAGLFALGCASHTAGRGEPGVPDDRRPVSEPEPASFFNLTDGFHNQFAASLKRALDISRHARELAGTPKQAFNLDRFDEVDDSAWFTNRIGVRSFSPEEVARGPNQNDGPDTSGAWTITSAKREGVTAGFTIKDSRGERYVIKLDARGFPELNSGAEIIGTKLFHAAGYHVPENHVAYFDPARLELGPNVMYSDAQGNKRPMNEADLKEIVDTRMDLGPDGKFRAIASRFLKGKIIGPFRYAGHRLDDANDLIPHEHRRELRGLRVLAAWLNHYDTKANNSLDVFVKEGYIRHYLIDFGSTLGSQGDEPMPAWIGHENALDPPQIATSFLALGFRVRPYEKAEGIRSTAVGYFESRWFDPRGYASIFPNPAFVNATNRDAYWGAKLVMAFSDDHIDAAVSEARYSDPADAEYVARVIKERRDITGRYWFQQVNPLDRFVVSGDDLAFADLAVEYGFEDADRAQYRYRIHETGKSNRKAWEMLMNPGGLAVPIGSMSNAGEYCVELQTRRGGRGWGKYVRVRLVTAPDGRRGIGMIEREE